MFKDSKICSFIAMLAKAFMQSKLYAVLLCIVNFFADSFAGSKTRSFLIGKGALEDNAGSSVFYTVISKIADAFLGIFTWFFSLFSKAYESSIVKRIYDKFFKQSYGENYIFFASFVSVFIFIIPHNFWSNTFGLLFAAVLFLLYVVALSTGNKEYMPGKNAKALWFCTLAFIFSLLLNCFISYDRADSIRVLLFFITSFMLCFVIYSSIRNEKCLDVICGFMYGALMITSLFAVAQGVLGVEADAALTDMELNEGMPGRVFSTLANPNNFAEFLVLFMPFGLAFALNRPRDYKYKLHLLCGMLLPLIAILLTYSRSGWMALIIAAVVFISMYDKKLIPVFIILGILAIPFIPQSILNRILTIGNLEDSSSSYRVDIWTGCLEMLKEYWFTGVGLGTGGFAEIYPLYAVGKSGVAPHSHMHFMEMLCELGVLGFVSYVCMTFTLIKRSLVACSRKVPEKIRNVAIASASSMTGIVLIGCFEYCWFYPRVMFAFFISAGIAMAVYKMSRESQN